MPANEHPDAPRARSANRVSDVEEIDARVKEALKAASQLRAVREKLKIISDYTTDIFTDGDVLRFTKEFPTPWSSTSTRAYVFAAIRAEKLWFLSGQQFAGQKLTWNELILFLVSGIPVHARDVERLAPLSTNSCTCGRTSTSSHAEGDHDDTGAYGEFNDPSDDGDSSDDGATHATCHSTYRTSSAPVAGCSVNSNAHSETCASDLSDDRSDCVNRSTDEPDERDAASVESASDFMKFFRDAHANPTRAHYDSDYSDSAGRRLFGL